MPSPAAKPGRKEYVMYQTKEDLLAKWETAETKAEAKSIARLRADISTARAAISDALARYRKKKLGAKSKKQATENPFEDLKEYRSLRDIQDAYGWEIISEREMDRLIALWELREDLGKQSTVYTDRVTEMLERAMRAVGDEYLDELMDYDIKVRQREREAERVARENNERTYQRERGVTL
jgi:hypothetical protein